MERGALLAQHLPNEVNGTPVDAAILTSAENCRYISGFAASARMLVITREVCYYLTDFRYAEAARAQVQGCKVVEYKSAIKSIEEILRRHNLRGVLLEYSTLTLSQAAQLRQVCQQWGAQTIEDNTLDQLLREQRSIKTSEEIARLRAAQAITDAAFSHILTYIQPGKTEREIALELEFFMRKNGADGIAFDTIVVAGKNGSQCHGVPGNKPIEHGELITMDFGAQVNGYHADMTRTVACGKINPEQEHVYQTVLQAQLAAIAAVKAGVPCSTVDKAARDVIDAVYPGSFGHTTGHSVGLEIHEWPYFAPNCHVPAQAGMVITVEPGIYLTGNCGVRIEDLVLVTPTGCENLTASPKELITL